ncbi:MAG: HAD-IB family hydrolase [Candidatus Azobacteroides sp.]|nr:HAD-IB family hydrolase [Candidatus Azobacteroides sp.]
MNVIAAFDFDGTLTRKDTLFDFLVFSFGKRKVISGLSRLSLLLLMYKAGFVNNGIAKQKLFSFFFRDMKAEKFEDLCKKYARRISGILKNEAIIKMHEHREAGHKVVIVSASVENWISPWAETESVDCVLGTQIEIVNDRLTGRFKSENCYGSRKVTEFLSKFPERTDYQLYAYGDSKGDKELLSIADFAFFKRF